MKVCKMIAFCLLLTITLSGCWSKEEPKALAIVDSIIYDVGNNGKFKITAELLNASATTGAKNVGTSNKSPSITITSSANSPREALSDIAVTMERDIFGGHNKVRFFTENLAKSNLTAVLDYLLRDPLTDDTPYMVIIDNKDPKEIYSAALGLSETVGHYIDNLSIYQMKSNSKSVFPTTLDFVKDYYTEGKQPVMGLIRLVDCDEKIVDNETQLSIKNKKVVYEGLAAFKEDKLVGYMDGTEARAYNFVTDKVKTVHITVATNGSYTVVEVPKSKIKIQTTVQNGKVTVTVKLKASVMVTAEGADIDVSKIEPLKTIEKLFDAQMTRELSSAIKKAQTEFKSDIFGFGQYVHMQHPKDWVKLKSNWDDTFATATVNVSVESSINRSGQIKSPFQMQG